MLIKSEIITILNDALNQTARLRKGGDQLTYYCPSCKHHKRKLEVCLEEGNKFGIFNCWTCGTSGNLGKLLKIIDSPRSYRDKLFDLTKDIRVIRKRSVKTSISELVLPDDFLPLAVPKEGPEYKNALVYLIRRGILREDIIRYNIGYCEEGPYERHIIVPSYDAKGVLNFFIGRRYYNTEGIIPYKKPLEASMNIVGFECFINYNEPINLCEGVFDCFAVRNNAIPLFGKQMSNKLKEAIIINKTPRVNMILDNDAMKESVRNCTILMRLGIRVHLVRLNGKDPSVMGFEKIHKLIQETPEFTDTELLRYKLGL